MKKLFGSAILVILAIVLSLSALSPTSISALSPANAPSHVAIGPGEFENSIVVGGETRDYIVHVPLGYDASKAVPLVIVLHPHGSSAKGVEKTSDISSKADKEDFVVVYPNGTGNPRAWNAGFYPLNPTPADDVAFVSGLIDKLEKDLHVDDKRIYVCGFSDGAFMYLSPGSGVVRADCGDCSCRGNYWGKRTERFNPDDSKPISAHPSHRVSWQGGSCSPLQWGFWR